jgi:hypothetical protein
MWPGSWHAKHKHMRAGCIIFQPLPSAGPAAIKFPYNTHRERSMRASTPSFCLLFVLIWTEEVQRPTARVMYVNSDMKGGLWKWLSERHQRTLQFRGFILT